MNEPLEGVAPTDSRFRPDQRWMESNDLDKADAAKIFLEEAQVMTCQMDVCVHVQVTVYRLIFVHAQMMASRLIFLQTRR